MKRLLLLITLLFAIFVPACTSNATESPNYIIVDDSCENVTVIMDIVTGVEYIVYGDIHYGFGICPRYNADGTLYNASQEE